MCYDYFLYLILYNDLSGKAEIGISTSANFNNAFKINNILIQTGRATISDSTQINFTYKYSKTPVVICTSKADGCFVCGVNVSTDYFTANQRDYDGTIYSSYAYWLAIGYAG